ncbi:MAG: hypothetical protein IID41_12660 [Planctomycetes bacterium]|nr:hypothetical protein [Planctomycetota bacterium]
MASIGSHRLHASLVFQKFGLAPFRRILSPELFADAALVRTQRVDHSRIDI